MSAPLQKLTDLSQEIGLYEDEQDAVVLWAEIHRLRAAIQGPKEFPSWQAAATAERIRRVKLEAVLVQAREAIYKSFRASWDGDCSYGFKAIAAIDAALKE